MIRIFILWMMVIFLIPGSAYAGLDQALDISTSALVTHKQLIEVVAQNVANIDSTRTLEGGPYSRKIGVLKEKGPRQNLIQANLPTDQLQGVELVEVVEDKGNYVKVYDPGHPDAGPDGFVLYPNIDMASELVYMSKISSTFEANTIVFSNTRQMMQNVLEIGR